MPGANEYTKHGRSPWNIVGCIKLMYGKGSTNQYVSIVVPMTIIGIKHMEYSVVRRVLALLSGELMDKWTDGQMDRQMALSTHPSAQGTGGKIYMAGIILDMGSVNKKWSYNVTSCFIGWAHTQNDACMDSSALLATEHLIKIQQLKFRRFAEKWLISRSEQVI